MWKYVCIAVLICFALHASEKRVWDQEAAKKKVEEVIATEKKGTPWNDIKWNSDVAKVVAKSKKEGIPIFLYVYVNEGGQKGTNC